MASDDIPTQAGQTVLHLAAQAGHVETVAALLDRGCDSNVLDSVSSERDERWESDLLPSTGGQEFTAAGSSRRSPGDCQAPAQCRGRCGPPGRAGPEHGAPSGLWARLQPGSLPPLLQQGKCLHEEQGRLRSSACGLSERSQPIMSGTSHQRLPAWHQEQRETRTQEENFGHLCYCFSSGTLRYTPPPGTDTQASPGSSSAPSVKSPSRTRTETRRSTSRQPWARGSLPGSWCRREWTSTSGTIRERPQWRSLSGKICLSTPIKVCLSRRKNISLSITRREIGIEATFC